MSKSINSVVLRAKARLAALGNWAARITEACMDEILSWDQGDRALNWTKQQIEKATRQLCAFSSRAVVQSMFVKTLGIPGIYDSIDAARETLHELQHDEISRTHDQIVEPLALAIYYRWGRV